MNPAQQLFAEALAAGAKQTDAYQQAFPNVARASARVMGCRLAKDKAVQARVAELLALARGRADEAAAANTTDRWTNRREWLDRLAALSDAAERNGEFATAVKAHVELGKALGHYEPQEVEITGADAVLARLMGVAP